MKTIETHELRDRLTEIGDKYVYHIITDTRTSEDGNVTYKYAVLELAKAMGQEMAEIKVDKLVNQIVSDMLNNSELSKCKDLIKQGLVSQHKVEWTASKQAEYDELYPMYRDMTEEEYNSRKDDDLEENPYNVISYEAALVDGLLTQVAIDYSQDETYLTFNEWLNETRVVSEAIEPTYDGEENQLTEAVAEVTELVRPYVANDVTALVEAYIGSKYAELRKAEYPDIGEQLDMMYKDLINGTTTWKDMINGIKTKYPKN